MSIKISILVQYAAHPTKFCMSHWEWVKPNHVGCCPKCGSAMLEDEDMR